MVNGTTADRTSSPPMRAVAARANQYAHPRPVRRQRQREQVPRLIVPAGQDRERRRVGLRSLRQWADVRGRAVTQCWSTSSGMEAEGPCTAARSRTSEGATPGYACAQAGSAAAHGVSVTREIRALSRVVASPVRAATYARVAWFNASDDWMSTARRAAARASDARPCASDVMATARLVVSSRGLSDRAWGRG